MFFTALPQPRAQPPPSPPSASPSSPSQPPQSTTLSPTTFLSPTHRRYPLLLPHAVAPHHRRQLPISAAHLRTSSDDHPRRALSSVQVPLASNSHHCQPSSPPQIHPHQRRHVQIRHQAQIRRHRPTSGLPSSRLLQTTIAPSQAQSTSHRPDLPSSLSLPHSNAARRAPTPRSTPPCSSSRQPAAPPPPLDLSCHTVVTPPTR